jgi:recombination DNA repair RAD52 pathway protein
VLPWTRCVVRYLSACRCCHDYFAQAKKEAVTDGVKRALRNFGNLLGLCLYEKSFTQEVVKIKPQYVCAPDSPKAH